MEERLQFEAYDEVPENIYIYSNGHGISFFFEDFTYNFMITKGGLGAQYKLYCGQLKWGSSEHTIDGVSCVSNLNICNH